MSPAYERAVADFEEWIRTPDGGTLYAIAQEGHPAPGNVRSALRLAFIEGGTKAMQRCNDNIEKALGRDPAKQQNAGRDG